LPSALLLAVRLADQARPASEQFLKTCGFLVIAGLNDGRSGCRADAVRLAASPSVNQLAKIPPLVLGATADSSPDVRRTALLLIAQREDLSPTDELLPLLHDNSFEVREICVKTLRSRGLSPAQIRLATWMTDSQASVRAQVPSRVLTIPDVDSQLWLDRLSRDPSPAVRAAVLRTMAEANDIRLATRMREIAADDPSPTIRELAEYYLRSSALRLPH
jgi:HEAT repeat protein